MRILLCLACMLPFLSGCSINANNNPAATQAIDAVDVTAAEGSLFASNADSLAAMTGMQNVTSEVAAQISASAWPNAFTPAGCATTAVIGNQVTAIFNGCTGPYGLANLSGTLVVLITVNQSSSSTSVAAVAQATGLSVDGAVLEIQAAATYTAMSGMQSLTVSSQSAGATGARGTAFVRQGGYSATWDQMGCVTVSGSWETTVGTRVSTLTVADYKRCAGMCPAAGGSIVDAEVGTGLFGAAATTVSFDGSSKASWSGSDGHGTVTLLCQ